MTIQRQQTNERMSQSVIHQGTVYLSGQLADNFGGDITQQTHETLQKIQQLLKEAGSDRQHILSATIYLKNMSRDFNDMNAVWDSWLPEGSAPARAAVEATMFDTDILVEIAIIAALPL